jgi:nucleotide-binding universal stress UspA family protein
MWKKYLVGIDGSGEASAAFACALGMAKRFGGAVTGLNVVDQGKVTASMLTPGMPYAPIDIKPLSFYSELQDRLTAMGKKALDEAAKSASKAGVEFTQEQTMGLPGDILATAVRSYDCLFIGKRGVTEGDMKGFGKEVLHVARHCPRPVLVADKQYDPFDNALIAYDGSPEAARALRVALDLGGKGGYKLHIVTVSEPQRAGETTMNEARSYLAPHGIDAEYHLMSGDPAEQILFAAAKHSCGMVIMGAFGHRTIFERAFGATTEELLRTCKLPVLLGK